MKRWFWTFVLGLASLTGTLQGQALWHETGLRNVFACGVAGDLLIVVEYEAGNDADLSVSTFSVSPAGLELESELQLSANALPGEPRVELQVRGERVAVRVHHEGHAANEVFLLFRLEGSELVQVGQRRLLDLGEEFSWRTKVTSWYLTAERLYLNMHYLDSSAEDGQFLLELNPTAPDLATERMQQLDMLPAGAVLASVAQISGTTAIVFAQKFPLIYDEVSGKHSARVQFHALMEPTAGNWDDHISPVYALTARGLEVLPNPNGDAFLIYLTDGFGESEDNLFGAVSFADLTWSEQELVEGIEPYLGFERKSIGSETWIGDQRFTEANWIEWTSDPAEASEAFLFCSLPYPDASGIHRFDRFVVSEQKVYFFSALGQQQLRVAVYDRALNSWVSSSWFPGEQNFEERWFLIPWFGWVYGYPTWSTESVAVWHQSFQAMHLSGRSPEAFWAYFDAIGWVYVSSGSFDLQKGLHYAWHAQSDSWLWLGVYEGPIHYVYHWGHEAWISARTTAPASLAQLQEMGTAEAYLKGTDLHLSWEGEQFLLSEETVIEGHTAQVELRGPTYWVVDPVFPSIVTWRWEVRSVVVTVDGLEPLWMDPSSLWAEGVEMPERFIFKIFFYGEESGAYEAQAILNSGAVDAVQRGTF